MTDTLTQKAYRHIHDKLSQGQLPPGTRLSNRGMAKEIGISLTPVREALNRLVSEGLLEHRQGLGVFVPQINPQEIREIYELREILESEAAFRACTNSNHNTISEMNDYYQQMADIHEQMQATSDAEAFEQLATDWQTADSAFHMTLLYAAGNRRLYDVVQGLQTSLKAMLGSLQRTPVLVAHRFDRGSEAQIERTLREHGQIIEALEQGDAKGGKRLMAEHIRTGCKQALAKLQHNRMNGGKQ